MTDHAAPTPYGLHAGFLQSAERHPDRPALEVDGNSYSYGQLRGLACRFACALASAAAPAGTLRTGILAARSLPVYTGLLGTLMAGGTVVPLNPAMPADRTLQMMALAGLTALVVDDAGLDLLPQLLERHDTPLLLLLPGAEVDDALARRWPRHRWVAMGALADRPDFQPPPVSPEAVACLFFTSGSTGLPKGVGVLHRNALRFVEMSVQRYREVGLSEQDRFSQFYDITFDSSMFDIHVGWAFGACVCCPSAFDWVNPNRFVERHHLTVIDIVPSLGQAMNRRSGWRAGRFPALRLCRFGGEALPADLAQALALAAPAAVVENVYGPTECTVDAAYYRWQPDSSPPECEHGVVPIGHAGPKVGLTVVDADLREVAVGSEGELLISGPQVTPGYWNDAERSAASFIRLPGSDDRFYRTGDLVRRPPPGQPMCYLGRLDFQIKIGGVRIELGEVENALRQAIGSGEAVALGWPRTASGASGIVAFVAVESLEVASVRARLRQCLPEVMVPHDIRRLDVLPLNVNGKVDRKALLALLQAEQLPD
jgi:amino acid adenylation domain-containing protein